jgi:hypothetical protein
MPLEKSVEVPLGADETFALITGPSSRGLDGTVKLGPAELPAAFSRYASSR